MNTEIVNNFQWNWSSDTVDFIRHSRSFAFTWQNFIADAVWQQKKKGGGKGVDSKSKLEGNEELLQWSCHYVIILGKVKLNMTSHSNCKQLYS